MTTTQPTLVPFCLQKGVTKLTCGSDIGASTDAIGSDGRAPAAMTALGFVYRQYLGTWKGGGPERPAALCKGECTAGGIVQYACICDLVWHTVGGSD